MAPFKSKFYTLVEAAQVLEKTEDEVKAMADAKILPPDRRSFRLRDLITKWGKEEHEILTLVKAKQLRAACWFEGVGLAPGFFGVDNKCLTVPSLGKGGCLVREEDIHAHSCLHVYKGWIWVTNEAAALLESKDTASIELLYVAKPPSYWETIRAIEGPSATDGQTAKICPAFYAAREIEAESGKVSGWVPVDFEFSRDDLVFLDFEVAQFEAENTKWLISSAGSIKCLKDGEKEKLLKVIGGFLIQQLAFDNKLVKKSGHPNYAQLQNRFVKELQKQGFRITGLEGDVLRKQIFKDALEMIQENKIRPEK